VLGYESPESRFIGSWGQKILFQPKLLLAYFSSKSPPINPNPGENYSFLLAKHYYAAPFPSFES